MFMLLCGAKMLKSCACCSAYCALRSRRREAEQPRARYAAVAFASENGRRNARVLPSAVSGAQERIQGARYARGERGGAGE